MLEFSEIQNKDQRNIRLLISHEQQTEEYSKTPLGTLGKNVLQRGDKPWITLVEFWSVG